jgi:hypothetical protein
MHGDFLWIYNEVIANFEIFGTIKVNNKYVWNWLVKLSLNMFFHKKFDVFYCNI